MTILANLSPAQQAELSAAVTASPGDAVARAVTAQSVMSGITPANFTRWHASVAKVLSGTNDAILAYVGDSTTTAQGAGDNPAPYTANARGRSAPARLAVLLNASGIPASSDGVFGGNQVNALNATISAYFLYNPAVSAPSSGTTQWYFENNNSLAGGMWRNTSSLDAWSLTPSLAFDRIDVYYVQSSSAGAFTVDIGGAALTTVAQSAPTSMQKVTVSTGGAPALGTINIRRTGTGAQLNIIGVIPRDSTKPRVQVLNLGWSGSESIDWTGVANPWNPGNALATLNPDLTLINLGVNDTVKSYAADTVYGQAMQTIVSKAKLNGGSCILIKPAPQAATRDPSNLMPAYRTVLDNLAAQNGCGIIDLQQRVGSYDSGNALGFYRDTVHMLAAGYADVGRAVYSAVML
jgi:lysophospholipase L1-like esterase